MGSTPRCAAFLLSPQKIGTRWDGVCFRRFLLDTVPDLGPFLNNRLLLFQMTLVSNATFFFWAAAGGSFVLFFRDFSLYFFPDAQARLLIPSLPPLRPNDRMLHHYRFIAPLMPTDDEGRSPLHYYDSAIQLARQAGREPTEIEFEVGIAAADEIKKMYVHTVSCSAYGLLTHSSLFETREEMLEGSTTDLSKLPLAL